MSSDTTRVVAAMYEAISNGQVDKVLALLAPKIEWTEAEKFPYYSGTWTSPQEVIEKLLIPASKDFSQFSAKADDYVCQDNRVVSMGAYVGVVKRTGKHFRVPFAHVWEVKDGKVTKFVMYTDTAMILEAFS
ncbi:MAG TPA: nuclear transport factor 2 family protein [Drouetiella sp.]